MATTDAGLVLGSKANEEGQIFLMPNAWSIIGDLIPEDRVSQVVSAMEKYLLRDYGTLLNYPAFTVPRTDIGYVTRYAPGLRENGGVYTHAATWAVSAFAKAGRNDLAYKAYRGICPPNRTLDPDRYLVEPYVTCGNSDGPISPFFGRGGWSWYTGSAQWLHRVAVCDLLGVRATYEGLLIAPCVPSDWQEFRYRRSFRNAIYQMTFIRKDSFAILVDGKPISGNLLPDFQDGKSHNITVYYR
jgi:cellobiose phosphorylase